MAGFFDSTLVVAEPTKMNYTPIPVGDYRVIISRTDDKVTKKGGRMLSAGMEVIEGEYKGRWIWHNFNYECANDIAQRIGQQQLKAICDAIGKPKLNSPEELKNKPFNIHVKVVKNEFKGELENAMSYVVKLKSTSPIPHPSTPTTPTVKTPFIAENVIEDEDIPF